MNWMYALMFTAGFWCAVATVVFILYKMGRLS